MRVCMCVCVCVYVGGGGMLHVYTCTAERYSHIYWAHLPHAVLCCFACGLDACLVVILHVFQRLQAGVINCSLTGSYCGLNVCTGDFQVLDMLGDDPTLPGGRDRTEAVITRLKAAFTGGVHTSSSAAAAAARAHASTPPQPTCIKVSSSI